MIRKPTLSSFATWALLLLLGLFALLGVVCLIFGEASAAGA